ncbi:MAG TPA: rhomboid family intramembrane serine protease [Gemmataceae bacterium]|jgi:membrane associated rhomboid family serine protease
MSETGLNPLESILRLCAASAPEPWYPRLYAKQTDVDPRALAYCLEELWLNGLIDKKPGNEETGPCISLTREGERVLLDPEALRRLRAGEPLSSSDRGAVIRQALRGRLRPRITVLLVLLNVLVFAAGYWYARQKGLDSDFLRGIPMTVPVAHLLEQSGALVPGDLLDGQWWRLLTAGFVHIGLLHIVMNMACLYFAGRFIEQLWGHTRYLVIYLVAILGGSVLVAAHPVELTAGASGGVCGILAAEAVWFLFNRRYLPRALLRQARTNFIINFVLLVFISSFENVSGWGHFGGAAAGALAALLMHLQRFGPPVWRWLALTGFVPLVWYGQYAIEHGRPKSLEMEKKWLQMEDQYFGEHYARPVFKAMRKAREIYFDKVEPVLEMHPTRRDPAKVEAVSPILAEQQRELTELADGLARAGPYRSPDAEEAREIGQQYVRAGVDLLKLAERVLRQGDEQTSKDRDALREQEQQVNKQRQEWQKLFQ